jgi:hypothetical protein
MSNKTELQNQIKSILVKAESAGKLAEVFFDAFEMDAEGFTADEAYLILNGGDYEDAQEAEQIECLEWSMNQNGLAA